MENKATPKYPGLWDRITRALGTHRPSEIAPQLGISVPSVSQWKVLNQVPSLENLVAISKLGGASIDWLLLGESSEPDLIKDLLVEEPSIRRDVRLMASKYGKTFLSQANDLVVVGLAIEGARQPTNEVEQAIADAARSLDLAEGEVPVYFGAKEHEIIGKIIAVTNRTFEEEVRELVLERLEEKGLVTTETGESNLIYFGESVPKPITLPLYGEIAAGEPLHIFPVNETIQVPNFTQKPGKQYMVLRVRGDSMIEERIFDGSMIICEVANSAEPGETVVAVIDGERATVKKYYPERGRIRLQPANPAHLPQYITAERLSIQGIVCVILSSPSGKV